MGQQQLLLLILSAIIVGIAIVMGINMFGENAVQANQDAVMQDVLTIASRAQGWFRRPAQLGGGGRSFAAFSNLSLINFDSTTENGDYSVGSPTAPSFVLTAVGKEDGDGDGTPMTATLTVFADSTSAMGFTNK
jgi:hypothetical protein